jgi:peroxiredoxin-like protein
MQPFPHRYTVTSVVGSEAEVILETPRVAPLRTALPTEFDGPGDRWSPETLLVAAIADCYAMTFRGVAARSKLEWTSLRLQVVGTLDRVNDVTRFTDIQIHATAQLPGRRNEALALRVLAKAEATCLITRSMTAAVHLSVSVECVGHSHSELVPQ